MLLIKSKLANSAIHGIGVFSDQFIAKGTPTWQFTTGFDRAHKKDELSKLDAVAKSWYHTYAYLDKRNDTYVLCADDARFINHSRTPNTVPDFSEDDFGVDVAVRDIQPGEEITIDYRIIEEGNDEL